MATVQELRRTMERILELPKNILDEPLPPGNLAEENVGNEIDETNSLSLSYGKEEGELSMDDDCKINRKLEMQESIIDYSYEKEVNKFIKNVERQEKELKRKLRMMRELKNNYEKIRKTTRKVKKLEKMLNENGLSKYIKRKSLKDHI
ncbi:hypothetical protein C1646_775849 [Rhizophagus diaphanus]|nr:hypothetical protein C1646_775849 [Rhizophagus diaphanus] [Rhizophagus sp. MUCL 43196]